MKPGNSTEGTAPVMTVSSQGVVLLSPEILSITPISLEKSPGARLSPDLSLYLNFYFKTPTKEGSATGTLRSEKKKDKERERAAAQKTPSRAKPWNFFDTGTYTFELPAPPRPGALGSSKENPSFCIELWAQGRLKSSLEGSLELSLDSLKTMVSSECESQKDFWFTLRSAAANVADLRIAVTFARKEATILRHIHEAIAIRLLSGVRGDASTTVLWPQTDSNSMMVKTKIGSRAHSFKSDDPKRDVGQTQLNPRIEPATPKLARHHSSRPATGRSKDVEESPTLQRTSSLRAMRDANDAPLSTAALTASSTTSASTDPPSPPPEIMPNGSRYNSCDNLSTIDTSPEGPPPLDFGMYDQSKFVGAKAYGGGDYGGTVAPIDPNSSSSSSSSDSEDAGSRLEKPRKKMGIVKWASDLMFNEAWQETVERMISEDGNTLPETYEALSDLSRKFVAVAKTYGSLIVRELHLPNERKTVRPMDVGGVIGGTKFVIAGILFKVAHGGDLLSHEPSAKIAGHELKALTALFNVNAIHRIGLALPMIALLDVMGHRLIALAMCPINASTLIHGSANAGHTILSGGVAEAPLMAAAARLNLKVHTINGHKIPLAVDCEVHASLDSRTYAIDLSRVLPPELPDHAKYPLSHLYRLLRPELVKAYGAPLCSDACSAFVSMEPDRDEHAREIADATSKLHKLVIPLSALALDQLHMARSDPDWKFYRLDHIHRILHVVHASGVNMRFLIAIMFHSRTKVSQQLLLVEATSRTVKKELRALMRRALKTAGEEPGGVYDVLVNKLLIDYWNRLLSQQTDAVSADLWDTVALSLQNYFGVLDPIRPWKGEQLRQELLGIPLGMLLLFSRINEQLGTQWSTRVTQLVDDSVHWLEAQEEERDVRRGGSSSRNHASGNLQTLRHFGKILPHRSRSSHIQTSGSGSGNTASSGSGSTGGASSSTGNSNTLSVPSVNEPLLRDSGTIPSTSTGSLRGKAAKESGDGSASTTSETTPTSQPRRIQSSANVNSAESRGDGAEEHPEMQSPWSFWTQHSSSLFFEDDLMEVGSRVKLNNQAAMAMGSKLMLLSDETPDRSLKAHFRLLASRFFDSALMSNPTSPVTLRLQARILLLQEGYRLQVDDPVAPGAMVPFFWSSTLRYIDFLYRVALDSDPNDSRTLFDYAKFLGAGGQSKLQQCWLLTRSVLADHNNNEAVESLHASLVEMGLVKEAQILTLWKKAVK